MLGVPALNVVIVIVVALAYLGEAIAYRETPVVRQHIEHLVCRRRAQAVVVGALQRWYDFPLGVVALLRTWLEVLISLLLIEALGDSVAPCFLLSIVIASRFRALQEIAHFAIHSALGSNAKKCFLMANVFFQFPLMRDAARVRQRTHVGIHHRQSNVAGLDPNLDDLRACGIVPGCGVFRLLAAIVFPLWPSSILRCLRNAAAVTLRGPRDEVLVRLALVSGLVVATFVLAGWTGVVFAWLLPRFLIYPGLAWLSQLLEHRWYAPMPDQTPYLREFHAGRATHYGLATKALMRFLILPVGDSYHLAHSLFPRLRWNYLPIADRLLVKHCADYAINRTHGLLFKRAGQREQTAFGWLIEVAQRKA